MSSLHFSWCPDIPDPLIPRNFGDSKCLYFHRFHISPSSMCLSLLLLLPSKSNSCDAFVMWTCRHFYSLRNGHVLSQLNCVSEQEGWDNPVAKQWKSVFLQWQQRRCREKSTLLSKCMQELKFFLLAALITMKSLSDFLHWLFSAHLQNLFLH